MKDEDARIALGHLIQAVEALVESLWHVDGDVAALAEQRAKVVEDLLKEAKAIVGPTGGNR